MNTLGWFLTGTGIYIFVALTAPLLAALMKKPETRDDAHTLVGICWAWPLTFPGLMLACAVMGIIAATDSIAERYMDVISEEKRPDIPAIKKPQVTLKWDNENYRMD